MVTILRGHHGCGSELGLHPFLTRTCAPLWAVIGQFSVWSSTLLWPQHSFNGSTISHSLYYINSVTYVHGDAVGAVVSW